MSNEPEGHEDNTGGLLGDDHDNSLHLKGQMMFMAEWNVIMFLCSPSLPDLDTLAFSGLYINDLSMHDFSRDLLLASEFFGRKVILSSMNHTIPPNLVRFSTI